MSASEVATNSKGEVRKSKESRKSKDSNKSAKSGESGKPVEVRISGEVTATGGSCADEPDAAAGSGGSCAKEKSCAKSESTDLRKASRPDTINSEFMYYSSVLKILVGTLTNEMDKRQIIPWAKKLFRPEYHSSQFREKRNKYLLYLAITLLNDEAYGIFTTVPPQGALPDLDTLDADEMPAAEWELDTTWRDTLENLSEEFQRLTCPVHENECECDGDHQLDNILDQEFHFLLYLLRPYASLLPNTFDRTRVATWMQTLCSVTGPSACSSMRGIRNDYIMALLGYVQNLRLVGPFGEYPPIRTLPPLAEAARLSADIKPITDPTGPEATDFLSSQPVPDDGAFCYIALTGDLIASSVIQPTGPAAPPN